MEQILERRILQLEEVIENLKNQLSKETECKKSLIRLNIELTSCLDAIVLRNENLLSRNFSLTKKFRHLLNRI